MGKRAGDQPLKKPVPVRIGSNPPVKIGPRGPKK